MHAKSIAKGRGKGLKWTTASKGSQKEQMPLITAVREHLGYADNAREAKSLLKRGLVRVNKKVFRDHKLGIGFMDVLEIPTTKQHFRVMTGSKGLYLKEIGEKESALKLCRVNGKRILKGGKTQISLHDGSNVITDKDVKVNDTVLLEMPSLKIKEVVKYEKGGHAMVYKGRNSGESGAIKDVVSATASRKSLTTINELQTLTEYVMVLGKDKPLIQI